MKLSTTMKIVLAIAVPAVIVAGYFGYQWYKKNKLKKAGETAKEETPQGGGGGGGGGGTTAPTTTEKQSSPTTTTTTTTTPKVSTAPKPLLSMSAPKPVVSTAPKSKAVMS